MHFNNTQGTVHTAHTQYTSHGTHHKDMFLPPLLPLYSPLNSLSTPPLLIHVPLSFHDLPELRSDAGEARRALVPVSRRHLYGGGTTEDHLKRVGPRAHAPDADHVDVVVEKFAHFFHVRQSRVPEEEARKRERTVGTVGTEGTEGKVSAWFSTW